MGGAVSYDNNDILIFKERLQTDNTLKEFYEIYKSNYVNEDEDVIIKQFITQYHNDPCISLYLANYKMYNKKKE